VQDLREKLPLGERNALLVLFSEENGRLKAQIANQQLLIDKLSLQVKDQEERIKVLLTNAGYNLKHTSADRVLSTK
jgi:hypothetical protein